MRIKASEGTGPAEDSEEVGIPYGAAADDTTPTSFWRRITNYFRPPDDGLTFKERLAKYGTTAVLAYLFISNVGGCLAVASAWYIFSATNQISPLAPGQWKGFLAIYSGFFVFLNVIRPLRFALALTIAPQFDRIIRTLQRKFRASRTVAIAWTVALFNVGGSFAVLFSGLAIASLLSGVPIWHVAK